MQGILNLQEFFSAKKAKTEFSKAAKPDIDPIIFEISQVIEQINCVRSRFDYITDHDMIDSCIYEEQALISRYSHLISLARKQGITCGHAQNLLSLNKGA